MAVIVLSPVEGLQPGETYEGPNEQFLVENGYAKNKGRRKFNLDRPTGIDYKHPEVAEPEAFGPTPTNVVTFGVSAETEIEATPPAAPAKQGPAKPTAVSLPTPAAETLL